MRINWMRFIFGGSLLLLSFLPCTVYDNKDFATLTGFIIFGIGELLIGLSFENKK